MSQTSSHLYVLITVTLAGEPLTRQLRPTKTVPAVRMRNIK